MPDGSDRHFPTEPRLALSAHPMAGPGEPRPVRPGQSLGELMEEAVPDPVLRAFYELTLDGVPVPQDLWAATPLEDGQLVNAYLVPAGGNDGRKFIRTVLQFAVMAAAIWIGGGAGGAITSKWLASAAAATVSLAGNLAINALVPLPQPGFGDTGERFSPAYYPETARNEAAFYQPVRVVFGEHRFFPALQGLPIQESVGEDVYLRYMLSLGPMPLAIDPASIRIGETPLSEFEGVDIELRLKPDDPPFTLYTGDTFQLAVGALLEGPGSWTTRTTQPDATEIAVVLGFRGGLGAKDDRNRNQPASVALEIQYRPAGSSDAWQDARATATGANGAVAELGTDRLNYGNIFANLEAFAFEAVSQQNAQTGPVSLTRREPGKPFRHVVRAFLPKGQYDVRVRRTNPATDDERIIDDVHWEFLDTVRAANPNPLPDHAAMALRIKGSNQLSGAIDTINLIARRLAPSVNAALLSGDNPDYSVITSADWQTVAETRNVADACLFVLQGPMVARKVPDHGINWPSLAALWKWSDVNNFRFDFILDRPMRRDDMLQMICAAARARPVRIEGQYHFVIDAERSGGPVQVFTGLNVRNFRVARTWPQPVHALRIPFLNRENDYRQDERILYLPGYSADGAGDTDAASLFERLELVGITDPEVIARLGYFHAATALSQTERYSFEVPDAEGLTARQGDLIGLQHDVLVTGLAAARVAGRTLNGSGDVVSIDIDTRVTLEEGVDYGVVRRRIEGAGAAPGRVTAEPALPLAAVTSETAGETSTLILGAPVDPSIAPSAGEMVILGETGKEYLEALVKATRGLDNWGAGVEAVAYAPNRFTAGEGSIPAFDPKVTVPVDRRPSAPVLAGLDITDEGIAIAFSMASGRTRDLARFDLGWRLHAEAGAEGRFEPMPPLPGTARVAVFPPGDPAERYDVSIVAVDDAGRQSDPLIVADLSASDALSAVTGESAEGVLSGGEGGARLPRLRVACDPILRDDVDVIHIEARPAGGLDTEWQVRDWLAPAEPGKDIANVDPGELIDVAFRARTRRGVYAPRVIVAAVQIPAELVSSDTRAVAGRSAAEVLEEIDELFQDVEDLIETYGSTESAAASAAAAAAAEAAAELAKTASQAAQAVSEAAAANANDAKALAESAAATATTQAGIATTAAGTAGGHATAAAGSASSAASSATAAGNSAAAANTSNLAAQATARDLLPGTFQNGLPNPYFTSSATGAPSAMADLATGSNVVAVTDAVFGPAIECGPGAPTIHTKGVVTVTPGAVYEVTTVWRATVNRTSTGDVRIRARYAALNESYTSITTATVGQQFASVAQGVQVFTYRYAVRLADGSAPTGVAYDVLLPTGTRYLRVGIAPHNGAVEDGKLVVGSIRVVDVTARQQSANSAASAEIARSEAVTAKNTAEGAASTATTQAGLAATSATNAGNSATAAANSASVATTKATEAEQSASAAQADRVAAQTARSGAEAAQTAAVSAKNDAEGAASTATTQAGIATTAAGNAGNSASAAAGSASSAASSATAAGNSATAANASKLAAEASGYRTFPSIFRAGLLDWTGTRAGSPETIARPDSRYVHVPNDPVFGDVLDAEWNAAGLNILTREAVQVQPGRLYRATVRLRVKDLIGGSSANFNWVACSMGANFAQVALGFFGGFTLSADTQFVERTYLWSLGPDLNGAEGIIPSHASAVWVRFGLRFNGGAASTANTRIAFFRLEDVTGVQSAAGSAASAEIARSDAVVAKNDAQSAASAAATSQSLAANSATQAGNSASAAATSASQAASSATAAGNSATAANSSSLSASASSDQSRLTASQGFPSDFREDGKYWTGTFALSPEASLGSPLHPDWSFIDTPEGRAARIAYPVSAARFISPIGVMATQPGRRYRFTVRARKIGGSGSAALMQWRSYNASFGTPLTSTSGFSVPADGNWHTFTFEQDTGQNGTNQAFFRAFFYVNASSTEQAGEFLDVLILRLEDITESAAAAGSAANASVSATQAVGAKNDAEGAAASAASSASVAATAATNAGNSASASASSASSASASADSAGNFAAQARTASITQAANIVRVDAAQGNGFFTNSQSGNPETISDQSVYSLVNTGGEGPRFSVIPDGNNKLLLPKAVFRHLPNQKYRFRIRWRHLGASAVTTLLTMRIENINETYSRISSTSTRNVDSTAGTAWQETVYNYTAPASPVSPFLRPHVFVRGAAGPLPDAVEIAWIEFEQVGASVATLEQAYLNSDGTAKAIFEILVAAAGSDPAIARFISSSGGSEIVLAASRLILANTNGSGALVAMQVISGIVNIMRELRIADEGALTQYVGSALNIALGKDPITGKRGLFLRNNAGDPLLIANITDQVFQLYPGMAVEGFAGVESTQFDPAEESFMTLGIPNTSPTLSHFLRPYWYTQTGPVIPWRASAKINIQARYSLRATASIFDWFYWRQELWRRHDGNVGVGFNLTGDTLLFEENLLWNVSQATNGASGNAASNAYPITQAFNVDFVDTLPASGGHSGGYRYWLRLVPIQTPNGADTPVEGFNKANTRTFGVYNKYIHASSPTPIVNKLS